MKEKETEKDVSNAVWCVRALAGWGLVGGVEGEGGGEGGRRWRRRSLVIS